MRARFWAVLLCALTLWAAPAAAFEVGEQLGDPALEARARDISKELRCLVCRNQSIDDSNAPLAQDLRQLVRERLIAGDTDAEVVEYVHARYGDYVLLRPPLTIGTVILWFGPALLLILVGGGLWLAVRRRRRLAAPDEAQPLSADERRRLDAALATPADDRERS